MARDRNTQVERDRYYMHLAEAVETGADCLGTNVGAVLVRGHRVISTGYNGTPSRFPNCRDHGCVRCYDSWLYKQGRHDEMSDPDHVTGAALDRCVCVHAEQNAFITAARFGIRVGGKTSTLYTTQSPCFNCLKEAVQADVRRIVFKTWYPAKYSEPLKQQYYELYNHLTGGDQTRFEALGGERPPIEPAGQPDPYASEDTDTEGMKPPSDG
jgi:dCMP deaminase